MKSVHIALATLCLAIQSAAVAAPVDLLKREGCDKKLQELATSYLTENSILLSIYEDQTKSNRTLDLAGLELCKSIDLDQGSFRLRRETSFCNQTGDSIVLFTYGDLYCDDEQVLGIKSLKLKKASGTN